MTAIAVPCPPPDADRIVEQLDGTPVAFDVGSFLSAVCRDTVAAAADSAGETVVVPMTGTVADQEWGDIESTVTDIADEYDVPRSSPVDVTISWPDQLLDHARNRSEASTVAILWPRSPLVQRRHVDAAAMQLRSHDIVVGPTSGAGWYFLGIDRAIEPDLPTADLGIRSIASRAAAEAHSLSTLPFMPGYRTAEELATLSALLETAIVAGESPAPHTRRWFESSAEDHD